VKVEIKNRFNDKIILSGKYESIKDCLEKNRDADLSYSDLSYSNLRGSNLSYSNLSYSNLSYSNLRGSNLSYSNLSNSNLSYSNLSNSNLSYSDLSNSNLRGSNLSGSDLRGSNLRYSNLSYSDLSNSNLRDSNLRGSKNYSESHDFFQEIAKRQKVDTFTQKEWSIIGQIIIHRLCWDTIKKRFNKSAMGIFKKLKKVGFGEWSGKYSEILREK